MHAAANRVFQNTLANVVTLRRALGSPVTIGVALLFLSFEPDPWASPQQIAEMADVSDDTVRRRLGELVSINRAECRIEGGRHLYRLRPAFIGSVMRKMKWDHTVIETVPELPQTAVAECD